MRAAIALGSNLGDSLACLRAARGALTALPGVSAPFLASRLYSTAPVGCPPGSPTFLNAVIELELTLPPLDFLPCLRACELSLGRAPVATRNAPRIIDLDLLYVGGLILRTELLTLPHPRAHERRFVLAPLAELRPELILPGQTLSVAELLANLPATPAAEPLATDW